jgi:outer membrane protein OmpA-like peptidoglycan-associated protein
MDALLFRQGDDMKLLPVLLLGLAVVSGCATQEPVAIVDKGGKEYSCRAELAACDAARLAAEQRDRTQVAATQALQRSLQAQREQADQALALKDAEAAACRSDLAALRQTSKSDRDAAEAALADARNLAARSSAENAAVAAGRDALEAQLQTAKADLAACNAGRDLLRGQARQAARSLTAKDADSAACRGELESLRGTAKAELAACDAARNLLRDQAQQAARSLAAKDAETAACRGDLATLRQTAQADQDACKAMTEKLRKQAQNVEKAAKQAQRMKELESGLRHRLQSEIGNKDVEIDRLRSQLSVRVLDRILFQSGSADILPQGGKVLDAVAAALAGGNETIRIEGHTDTVPIGPALKDKYF